MTRASQGNGGSSGPSIDLGRHQSQVGHAQRAQRELARRVIDAMKERLGVPEPSQKIGRHQRRQLRVPTSEQEDGTVVSVGRRFQDVNFDGYGLATIAHIALAANGEKAKSTLTMQAIGQTVLQSVEDGVYVSANGPAVVTSNSTASVLARGGVVLGAGAAPAQTAMLSIGGDGPAVPDAIANAHPELAGAAHEVWKSWHDDAGDAATERDELQSDIDPDEASERKPTQDEVTAKNLATSTFVDNNQIGQPTTEDGGGVAIHGGSGVLIASPKFAALHAGDALTITSDMPALVAWTHLDLFSGQDTKITAGRHGALYAAQKMRLVANEGDLLLATRKGDKLEVMATKVHLGELAPADPQEETQTVSLRAKKRVSIGTDKDASRDEGDEGFFVESHEVVEVKSDKTITLDATEELTLKITDQDFSLVIDDDGKITITSDQTSLAISDDDGLVFGKNDDYLKVSSNKVFAGLDSNTKVEVTSSSVSIKGSRIELG